MCQWRVQLQASVLACYRWVDLWIPSLIKHPQRSPACFTWKRQQGVTPGRSSARKSTGRSSGCWIQVLSVGHGVMGESAEQVKVQTTGSPHEIPPRPQQQLPWASLAASQCPKCLRTGGPCLGWQTVCLFDSFSPWCGYVEGLLNVCWTNKQAQVRNNLQIIPHCKRVWWKNSQSQGRRAHSTWKWPMPSFGTGTAWASRKSLDQQ